MDDIVFSWNGHIAWRHLYSRSSIFSSQRVQGQIVVLVHLRWLLHSSRGFFFFQLLHPHYLSTTSLNNMVVIQTPLNNESNIFKSPGLGEIPIRRLESGEDWESDSWPGKWRLCYQSRLRIVSIFSDKTLGWRSMNGFIRQRQRMLMITSSMNFALENEFLLYWEMQWLGYMAKK